MVVFKWYLLYYRYDYMIDSVYFCRLMGYIFCKENGWFVCYLRKFFFDENYFFYFYGNIVLCYI